MRVSATIALVFVRTSWIGSSSIGSVTSKISSRVSVRLPPPPKTSVGALSSGCVSPAEADVGCCTVHVTGFTMV